MAKKEKFVFEQFDLNAQTAAESISNNISVTASPTKATKAQTPIQSIIANLQTAAGSKVTFDCPPEMLEKLKDYGYWEGLSMRDIIIEAVTIFLDKKNFKTRPDKVKNKKKVGRKPKSVLLIQQALGGKM